MSYSLAKGEQVGVSSVRLCSGQVFRYDRCSVVTGVLL